MHYKVTNSAGPAHHPEVDLERQILAKYDFPCNERMNAGKKDTHAYRYIIVCYDKRTAVDSRQPFETLLKDLQEDVILTRSPSLRPASGVDERDAKANPGVDGGSPRLCRGGSAPWRPLPGYPSLGSLPHCQ